MSWKFVVSDDFDLAELKEMKRFFEQDLEAAKEYAGQVRKFLRTFKSKNSDWILKQAMDDIKVSRGNLAKVNEAIKIAEGKADKYETKYKNEPTKEEEEENEERRKRFGWF